MIEGESIQKPSSKKPENTGVPIPPSSAERSELEIPVASAREKWGPAFVKQTERPYTEPPELENARRVASATELGLSNPETASWGDIHAKKDEVSKNRLVELK